jgi:hypothetical protein
LIFLCLSSTAPGEKSSQKTTVTTSSPIANVRQ